MTPQFIEKMLNFSVIAALKVIFSRINSDTIRLRFNYTFTAWGSLPMLQSKKLTLALLINAALVSTAFASEQSQSKGFVEDANGSVLFRTGYLNRDKKDGLGLVEN